MFGNGHVRGGMAIPMAVVEGRYVVGIEEDVVAAFVVYIDCADWFRGHVVKECFFPNTICYLNTMATLMKGEETESSNERIMRIVAKGYYGKGIVRQRYSGLMMSYIQLGKAARFLRLIALFVPALISGIGLRVMKVY